MIEPAANQKDTRCHSPRTVADQYETPTLGDMAEALTKFPRYEVAYGARTAGELGYDPVCCQISEASWERVKRGLRSGGATPGTRVAFTNKSGQPTKYASEGKAEMSPMG
jgi:hypothetical protein